MKWLKLIAILLCCIIVFTGCWDFEDTNNKSIVISGGVDKLEDDIEFVVEVTSSKGYISKKQADEFNNINFQIYKNTGKNFEDTRKFLDRISSNSIYLGVIRVVTFGQKFSYEGISSYLNRIDSMQEYRKAVIPVVCAMSIDELYKIKIENDIGVGFYLENSIKNTEAKGTYYYLTIPEILNRQSLGLGYLLPYITLDNNKVTAQEFGVMNEKSKLIDVITKNQTDKLAGSIFLLNNKASMIINVKNEKDEDNQYVFNVKLKKKSIKANYDGHVRMNINLKVDAYLQYEYETGIFNDELEKNLEEELRRQIKRYIVNTIKFSEQINCDYIGFAQYFNKRYPKLYKTLKWKEEYRNLEADVNVDVKFINDSLMNIEKK